MNGAVFNRKCSVMDLKLCLLFYAEQVVSLAADCMIPQCTCIIED